MSHAPRRINFLEPSAKLSSEELQKINEALAKESPDWLSEKEMERRRREPQNVMISIQGKITKSLTDIYDRLPHGEVVWSKEKMTLDIKGSSPVEKIIFQKSVPLEVGDEIRAHIAKADWWQHWFYGGGRDFHCVRWPMDDANMDSYLLERKDFQSTENALIIEKIRDSNVVAIYRDQVGLRNYRVSIDYVMSIGD